ncbi:MAG TPA: hypothetical protein VHU42_12210, partial [Rhodopila sp.]|nr:hypothetical protein [Rhodopila sp.]
MSPRFLIGLGEQDVVPRAGLQQADALDPWSSKDIIGVNQQVQTHNQQPKAEQCDDPDPEKPRHQNCQYRNSLSSPSDRMPANATQASPT